MHFCTSRRKEVFNMVYITRDESTFCRGSIIPHDDLHLDLCLQAYILYIYMLYTHETWR